MMALDKLVEQPRLVYDRHRIVQGGGALADYLNDLVKQLEEWNYNVSRYANHFRGWTASGDFNKIDGGDAYTGSIVTAGVALAAITDGASSYTQATTPVANGYAEHTVPFTSTGNRTLLWWGGTFKYGDPGQNVSFGLYDGAVSLAGTEGVTLTSGLPIFEYVPHVIAAPTVGAHTFKLVTNLVGGGIAYVSRTLLIVQEFKR